MLGQLLRGRKSLFSKSEWKTVGFFRRDALAVLDFEFDFFALTHLLMISKVITNSQELFYFLLSKDLIFDTVSRSDSFRLSPNSILGT